MPRLPIIWRLPPSLLHHFNLAALIAADERFPWSEGRLLLSQFDLEPAEKRFVLRVLRERANYQLYRCSQRHACADFAVIDMSIRNPERRSIVFLELKANAKLSSPSPEHRQFLGCERARDQIAAEAKGLWDKAPILRRLGDEEALIAWLGARHRFRSPSHTEGTPP